MRSIDFIGKMRRIHRWEQHYRIVATRPLSKTFLIGGRIDKNDIKFLDFTNIYFSQKISKNPIRKACQTRNFGKIFIIEIKQMPRNRMRIIKSFAFWNAPNRGNRFIGQEKCIIMIDVKLGFFFRFFSKLFLRNIIWMSKFRQKKRHFHFEKSNHPAPKIWIQFKNFARKIHFARMIAIFVPNRGCNIGVQNFGDVEIHSLSTTFHQKSIVNEKRFLRILRIFLHVKIIEKFGFFANHFLWCKIFLKKFGKLIQYSHIFKNFKYGKKIKKNYF